MGTDLNLDASRYVISLTLICFRNEPNGSHQQSYVLLYIVAMGRDVANYYYKTRQNKMVRKRPTELVLNI